MLSEYLPDHLPDIESKYVAEYSLIGTIDDTAHPRSVPQTPHTAYIHDNDDDEPAIATRSITDSIDWDAVPNDHDLYQYCGDNDDEDNEEWDRDLVTDYSRIRGAAAHAAYTVPDTDNITDRLRDELADIHDIDDPEAMYEAVYNWPGSKPQIPPPEVAPLVRETITEELHRQIEEGARLIADNWLRAESNTGWHTLINEATIVAEVDGTWYCARPDQIIYPTDESDLRPHLYNLDAKAVVSLHPEHVVQAEAQRRAIDSRVADDADVHAIILQLGVDRGDWSIHSSLDDDWPGDKAWDMFNRRAKSLYNDDLVDAALSLLDN